MGTSLTNVSSYQFERKSAKIQVEVSQSTKKSEATCSLKLS